MLSNISNLELTWFQWMILILFMISLSLWRRDLEICSTSSRLEAEEALNTGLQRKSKEQQVSLVFVYLVCVMMLGAWLRLYCSQSFKMHNTDRMVSRIVRSWSLCTFCWGGQTRSRFNLESCSEASVGGDRSIQTQVSNQMSSLYVSSLQKTGKLHKGDLWCFFPISHYIIVCTHWFSYGLCLKHLIHCYVTQ